ncbi:MULTISPECIES: PD-(D/E)XK motif protein [unclassified Streptomyces]|uniref:PD-(D/E)XK motif protein n=1 Tax=unclassified Streptomyces TaxID=2593676 RepID=UPI002E1D6C95|nr:PD-(D/E)XK motif protein [Streptomyces sp. NBC_01023]
MSEDELRKLVQERWTALEVEQTTGEHRLRVSQLPLLVEGEPLAVAVDHDGHRHVLIPVRTHRRVRSGLDGPVLRLRKRVLEGADSYQAYADLACLRDDLSDVFTELCVDVLGAAEELPENPVKALHGVLDRWKAFFRTQVSLLGPDQISGLFGELLLLCRLLEQDPGAHRLWRGPEGHRHDFSAGATAIEVKSSTGAEGRRPRIHGLDQLEVPAGGRLSLIWFRLQRTTVKGSGTAFGDLIARALHLCDDEAALRELLARAGYRPSDAEHYHDVRFVVGDERWYMVDDGFPGLTGSALVAAGVPVSILDVEYTIDLSGEVPEPLAPGQVSQVIDCLIQESM